MKSEEKTNQIHGTVSGADFQVDLNIPPDLQLVKIVSSLAASLMELRGYDEDDQEAIRFAIHETLVNAIQYGSRSRSDARITIKLYFIGQCFYTDIEDEGEGFSIEDISDPTSPDNLLKANGRGLFLVKQLTQQFEVTNLPDKGVRVSFCRLKHGD